MQFKSVIIANINDIDIMPRGYGISFIVRLDLHFCVIISFFFFFLALGHIEYESFLKWSL